MSETNKVMSSIQFPNTDQPYQVQDPRIPANPGNYQYLVTDGEGNTGWADRLAYEYLGEKFDFDIKEISGGQFVFTREKEIELLSTVGTVMLVTVGGTDYECRMEGFQFSGMQSYYCGNLYKFAELNGLDPSDFGATQDTGEPFVIMCVATEAMVVPFDGSSSDTIKVSALVETIRPIPDEYLPVRTAIIKGNSYDAVAAGGEAQSGEETYSCVNMDLETAIGIMKAGKPLKVLLMYAPYVTFPDRYSPSETYCVDCSSVTYARLDSGDVIIAQAAYCDMNANWDADLNITRVNVVWNKNGIIVTYPPEYFE